MCQRHYREIETSLMCLVNLSSIFHLPKHPAIIHGKHLILPNWSHCAYNWKNMKSRHFWSNSIRTTNALPISPICQCPLVSIGTVIGHRSARSIFASYFQSWKPWNCIMFASISIWIRIYCRSHWRRLRCICNSQLKIIKIGNISLVWTRIWPYCACQSRIVCLLATLLNLWSVVVRSPKGSKNSLFKWKSSPRLRINYWLSCWLSLSSSRFWISRTWNAGGSNTFHWWSAVWRIWKYYGSDGRILHRWMHAIGWWQWPRIDHRTCNDCTLMLHALLTMMNGKHSKSSWARIVFVQWFHVRRLMKPIRNLNDR